MNVVATRGRAKASGIQIVYAKTFSDVSGFGYTTRCGLATDGVALCWGPTVRSACWATAAT
jgi:hypothetical protein